MLNKKYYFIKNKVVQELIELVLMIILFFAVIAFYPLFQGKI